MSDSSHGPNTSSHSEYEVTSPIGGSGTRVVVNNAQIVSNTVNQNRIASSRRARGKSALVICFLLVDLAYITVILSSFMFLTFPITIGLWEFSKNQNLTSFGEHFCIQNKLSKHVVWISLSGLVMYAIGFVLILLSVILLSLKLAYGYIFSKGLNVMLNFISLMIQAYYCRKWGLYIQLAVFFIAHLPLQALGLKTVLKFIHSMKRSNDDLTVAPIRRGGTGLTSNEGSRTTIRSNKSNRFTIVDG